MTIIRHTARWVDDTTYTDAERAAVIKAILADDALLTRMHRPIIDNLTSGDAKREVYGLRSVSMLEKRLEHEASPQAKPTVAPPKVRPAKLGNAPVLPDPELIGRLMRMEGLPSSIRKKLKGGIPAKVAEGVQLAEEWLRERKAERLRQETAEQLEFLEQKADELWAELQDASLPEGSRLSSAAANLANQLESCLGDLAQLDRWCNAAAELPKQWPGAMQLEADLEALVVSVETREFLDSLAEAALDTERLERWVRKAEVKVQRRKAKLQKPRPEQPDPELLSALALERQEKFVQIGSANTQGRNPTRGAAVAGAGKKNQGKGGKKK